MIWISSESVFEYFHIAMMALGPISFFGKRQCGYHLKAFFEYFYRVHSQGLGYCQMDHFLHLTSHLQCSLLLTAVLPHLVSCVLYHLVQLNFLHFMRTFTDFWNFSHLCFKKYFAIISCLLVFGIMIQVWAWSHEFSPFFKDSLVFLSPVQIMTNIAKQLPMFTKMKADERSMQIRQEWATQAMGEKLTCCKTVFGAHFNEIFAD